MRPVDLPIYGHVVNWLPESIHLWRVDVLPEDRLQVRLHLNANAHKQFVNPERVGLQAKIGWFDELEQFLKVRLEDEEGS